MSWARIHAGLCRHLPQAIARARQVFANVTADAEPMLAEALAVNTRNAEELFADSIRSFLRGAVPEVPPDVPAPRALIARYRETRTVAASLIPGRQAARSRRHPRLADSWTS